MKLGSSAIGARRWTALLWGTLAVQLFTYCSGNTQTSGGGSGSGGASGQTSACPECPQGCGKCNPAGSGGVGGQGVSGQGGNAGQSGSAGAAGTPPFGGFGGHTAGCIGNPCMPGCGAPPSSCGGSNPGEGGGGEGGASDGAAGAGEAGQGPNLFRRVPGFSACYPLSGYEPDPCLPADDSLLPWLRGVPPACDAHVTAELPQHYGRDGRECCYSVTCRELAE